MAPTHMQGWRVFAGVRRAADADAAAAAHRNIAPLLLDVMHEDSVIAAAQQASIVVLNGFERHVYDWLSTCALALHIPLNSGQVSMALREPEA